MLAFLTRRKDTPMPDTTATETPAPQADDNVVMRFLTQGGATVELYPHAWTETHYNIDNKPRNRVDREGFEWRCLGCDETGADKNLRLRGAGYHERQPRESRNEANQHASTCRAMPKPTAA
jgi:hypothetical protein